MVYIAQLNVPHDVKKKKNRCPSLAPHSLVRTICTVRGCLHIYLINVEATK